tara:strand:+ start:146 stop:250 length:105 start_codon:yes stop_codon:yes gene_type:complete
MFSALEAVPNGVNDSSCVSTNGLEQGADNTAESP